MKLCDLKIGVKGGGDLATGIVHCLTKAGFSKIFIMEAHGPMALRRKVAFAQAVYDNEISVEGITAKFAPHPDQLEDLWKQSKIPVLTDPQWTALATQKPDILIDAIMAKRNLGTQIIDASLVIGLGPGFTAGTDVDLVIETQRGHDLGRIIFQGPALANTSVPEAVMGITSNRLVRAPGDGEFISSAKIGDLVAKGQILGHVNDTPIKARIKGIIRGLVQDEVTVIQGKKIGDIDPRQEIRYCQTISDKARTLGGSVLEAILGRFNR